MSPTLRGLPGLLLLILLVTACGTGDTAMPGGTLPAAFADGVPEPSGEVVLSVTAPDGATSQWDVESIAGLEQHDLTIVEPFLEEEHTYTGPLWADVLRASGVDLETAGTAELVALDDFVADIPVTAATLDGLLLAHEEDGEPIPVAAGGPIRLVFPPGNPTGENLNNWIWSIRSATVS